jgi:hypothetical protein
MDFIIAFNIIYPKQRIYLNKEREREREREERERLIFCLHLLKITA